MTIHDEILAKVDKVEADLAIVEKRQKQLDWCQAEIHALRCSVASLRTVITLILDEMDPFPHGRIPKKPRG